MSKIDLVREYFSLLNEFATSAESYLNVLHPDFIHTEYPNPVTKHGQERDFAGSMKGVVAGKQILSRQALVIQKWFESENAMTVEAIWTGTMAVSAGHLHEGQELKAHFCVVLDFKEGKIYRQRNYDCYDPF